MINEQIIWFTAVKGGEVMKSGQVVRETEKAVQVHFEVYPVFYSGMSNSTGSKYSTWIPKSCLKKDAIGSYTIKGFFKPEAIRIK